MTCPEFSTGNTKKEYTDKAWIYTYLVQQILTQEPQSYLHMQSFVPIIVDSIRSNVRIWMERTLWVCLRMLMHAPIGTPLYGFLHIESLASISVLRRVHSAARGTESMFRLVLVITEDIPFALDKLRLDDCIDLDLTSEGSDFKEALDPVIKRSGDRPLEPNTGFTSFKPNDSEESTKIDAMLFQVLLLRLESLGRWAFVALPWIAYAIRPLSMQELDLIPAFEDAQLAAERILLIYFTALQLISRKFYQKLLRSAKGELSFAYLIQRYSIFCRSCQRLTFLLVHRHISTLHRHVSRS